MVESNTRLAEGTQRTWFVALVAYYVLATYLVPSSAKVERFSFIYFAFIVPAWLYVAANWRYLVSGYGAASKLLALFTALAGFFGVARGDYSLAYNGAFLSMVAIVILNSRVYLTLVELNWMLLATVIGSVMMYFLGITEYGFLPGQANAPFCHEAMNWRISLFRVTAESAMFSFLVLAANIIYGDRLPWRVRGMAMLIATYFLIFSGVRSIALTAIAVCLIFGLSLFLRLTGNTRRFFFAWAVVISATILSVPYFLGQDGGFWKNYVLRTETCDYLNRYKASEPKGKSEKIPLDWYAWTFNRHCAAMYQLSVFTDSPLGSEHVKPKSDQQLTDIGCPSDQLSYYCASCNFSTYWLARAGIAAIPLLMCFLALMAGAIMRRNAALSWILAVFGVVSFSWGVMFVPYNFIFLLMMAMPALVSAHERHRVSS